MLRPADADEVAESWRIAVNHRSGPVALVLTRQKLSYMGKPDLVRSGVPRGAYIVSDIAGGATADVIIIATGSEVEIALAAQAQLSVDGVTARVVSAPSLELFAKQDASYRDSVLPVGVPRVAVEAAHPASWYRWVGDTGAIVGIEHFGASAPAPVLYKEYGITAEKVAEAARGVIAR